MTTAKSAPTFRFPDPPEREPDDMTSFDHLARTGSVHHLMHHLGRSRNHHSDRGALLCRGLRPAGAFPACATPIC